MEREFSLGCLPCQLDLPCRQYGLHRELYYHKFMHLILERNISHVEFMEKITQVIFSSFPDTSFIMCTSRICLCVCNTLFAALDVPLGCGSPLKLTLYLGCGCPHITLVPPLSVCYVSGHERHAEAWVSN